MNTHEKSVNDDPELPAALKKPHAKANCTRLPILTRIEKSPGPNVNLPRNLDFNERFFKIKRFQSRAHAHSLSPFLVPPRKGSSPNKTLLNLPNKTSLLSFQVLKTSLLSKNPLKTTHFPRKTDEKASILAQFQDDKDRLHLMLKGASRRKTMIIEEKREFFEEIERMNQKMKSLRFDGLREVGAKEIIGYLEFQNMVKDQEYLIGKGKTAINQELESVFREYHEKRGRKNREWSLCP